MVNCQYLDGLALEAIDHTVVARSDFADAPVPNLRNNPAGLGKVNQLVGCLRNVRTKSPAECGESREMNFAMASRSSTACGVYLT